MKEIATKVHQLNNEELIKLRIIVDNELNERSISFSVGEIGEKLVIEHFNITPGLPTLKIASRGTKNVDALSKEGDRYSIKTILKAKKTGTIYPDTIDKDKQLFEYLLIVLLTTDYKIKNIFRFSWNQFQFVKLWDKRMNAWYIPISKKKLELGEIIY